MKTNKAFTLIELLVVVLIIGILAAIAVPQYQKSVMKSRFAQLKIMAKAIKDAEEVYYLANGKYATSFDDLDISMPNNHIERVSAENSDKLAFDWGECWVIVDQWGSRVACAFSTDPRDLIVYMYFINSQYNSNQTHCRAYSLDENSVYNHICQEESGKSPAGISTDEGYMEYHY